MENNKLLSDWIVVEDYCATRVLLGTDPQIIENRIAFIEKSPRVLLNNEWVYGNKGKGGCGNHEELEQYGFDKNSRDWCDKMLLSNGYILNKPIGFESKDLSYWKNNCEEDYINTPISVLRYISELEKRTDTDKPNNNVKFDAVKFKDYVKTYDTSKHGLDNSDVIIKDMVYGLGICLDETKYSFYKGYKLFKEYLKNTL